MWRTFREELPKEGDSIEIKGFDGEYKLGVLPEGQSAMFDVDAGHKLGRGEFYLINHLIEKDTLWREK